MKKIAILLLVFCCQIVVSAQQHWTPVHEKNVVLNQRAKRYTFPENYSTQKLSIKAFEQQLQSAPTKSNEQTNVSIDLPLPDGNYMTFEVYQSRVMHPNLAARYPMIKTYMGYSKDKKAKVRLDVTTKGLHALIDHKGKSVYIDPYAVFQDEYYMSYYGSDLLTPELKSSFTCGVDDEFIVQNEIDFWEDHKDVDIKEILEKGNAGEPVQLRTYRMAITCTGEYAQFHGGTVEDALSAIVTSLNRLNMVFERDAAVRMELIENNDDIIYLSGNIDPFTNGQTDALINESQEVIDDVIGLGFYDFGHVYSQGGYAGLAQLGAACSSSKARGASTMQSPVNDAFTVSLVGHEMGHQMGANHSMSSCHNVNSGTAYEPGGGSTIMSYAGICGAENNLVGDSDDYYFTYSLSEIFRYMHESGGNLCAKRTETGNTTPIVEIPHEDGFYIPIGTPFEIEVNATDNEDENLTYCWEQMDLGPMSVPGFPEGNCPLFRSYPPNDNPLRVFPRMQTIVNNQFDRAEILPPYSRDMTFRCTVRDNNINGGGVSWDVVEFEATDAAGPFKVMNPNVSNTSWKVGSYVEVNWDVANTNGALVDCQEVDILLSLDGGYTYPITLAEKAINDGSDFVLVPDELSSTARIKIKASENIFFDISDANFKIEAPTTPGYSLATTPNFFQVCLPEMVVVDINTTSLLGYNENVELSVIGGLPVDVSASFSSNSIVPSETSQLTLDFSNTTIEDTYEVIVQSVAPNADTIVRSIVLTTVSNDYTNLILQTPEDGLSGASGLPTFDWSFAEDANNYSIQIATNPSFDAAFIVEQADNVTESPFTPSVLLEENTLYYWRVLPYNECGEGQSSKIFAFHSKSISCSAEEAFDTPIQLSASQVPSLESKISVAANGTISDINIAQIKGSHEFFSDMRLTLTSPAGTTRTLFSGKCANYNGSFNMTLDDEAPSTFFCPPSGTMRPQQSLSAFIGESTQGVWTLKIEDTVAGAGGIINDWSIEFCADINLSNPQLLTNEVMPIPPGTSRFVNAEFLYAEDNNNESWELKYTLVQPVQHGTLYVEDVPVQVGDQFNQGQVTWDKFRYEHDGSDTEEDSFEFTIKDGEGGWTGTHTFNISIDPDAVVSNEEVLTSNAIVVFPNPAQDVVTIQLKNTFEAIDNLRLYNVLGEEIAPKITTPLQSNMQLNVNDLSEGIYIIQLDIDEQTVSQKISVVK